jgi:hypothetical protein
VPHPLRGADGDKSGSGRDFRGAIERKMAQSHGEIAADSEGVVATLGSNGQNHGCWVLGRG